jgi:hypothetical protein
VLNQVSVALPKSSINSLGLARARNRPKPKTMVRDELRVTEYTCSEAESKGFRHKHLNVHHLTVCSSFVGSS